jgi:chemotaxis protein histidine kinase CheA
MAENSETPEQRPAGKAEIIEVPNTIRKKVSGGGPISNDMLKRAESVIVEHGAEYVSRAQAQVDGLVKTAKTAQADPQKRAELFEQIFQQSHDIRGMGSTFGYDLVTAIGGSLCNFIEDIEKSGEAEMDVVLAHVEALRAIISNEVKGDGGNIGREIYQGLVQAVAKVAPPKKPEPEKKSGKG